MHEFRSKVQMLASIFLYGYNNLLHKIFIQISLVYFYRRVRQIISRIA